MKQHSRITELDGLRGIAACLVLAHHAFPVQIFWGWLAMEGFFALSGFLITTILLRIDLTRPIAIRNFLIRRAIRIWPVYFFALASAFAIWCVFYLRAPAQYGNAVWWKCIFFIQFTEGYWRPGEIAHVFNYAPWFRLSWSLAVEEQYYIIWPALIMLARGRRSLMIVVCIALVLLCFYMRAAGYSLNLLLTRGDGFAVGSAMAILQESLPRFGAGIRRRVAWLYAAAFVVGAAVCGSYVATGYISGAVQTYSDILAYGAWTTNVFFASLLAVGIIGLLRNGQFEFVRRAISIKPLLYMGEISLSVYLFQAQVFVVLRTLAKGLGIPHGAAVEIVAMLCCIVVGDISRRLIERPVNRLKSRFPAITADGRTAAEVISADDEPRPRPELPADQRQPEPV